MCDTFQAQAVPLVKLAKLHRNPHLNPSHPQYLFRNLLCEVSQNLGISLSSNSSPPAVVDRTECDETYSTVPQDVYGVVQKLFSVALLQPAAVSIVEISDARSS